MRHPGGEHGRTGREHGRVDAEDLVPLDALEGVADERDRGDADAGQGRPLDEPERQHDGERRTEHDQPAGEAPGDEGRDEYPSPSQAVGQEAQERREEYPRHQDRGEQEAGPRVRGTERVPEDGQPGTDERDAERCQ